MTANPNPNPNPNPNTNSIPPMEPRSRALTLVLAFVLALHSPLPALSSAVPSPSPSPSPAPLLPPPKQLMADPAGRRPSPPANSHYLPPPHSGFPCPGCHHLHNPGATAVPPHHIWKLNFGQLMGITLAAVALALQVALGGFLVYKRLQLRKAEMQYRQRLGPSSPASSS